MKNLIQEQGLLTPHEVCEYLGVHYVTLWRWTKEKKLTVYGFGHKKYYKKAEIDAALTTKSNIVECHQEDPD